MTNKAAETVADLILDAHRTRSPVAPIRDHFPAGAIDLAYAAQEINTERWLGEGRRLVGRKIGLTSLAVQKQLGVSQPDYGLLFDDMAVPDGWDVPADRITGDQITLAISSPVAYALSGPCMSALTICCLADTPPKWSCFAASSVSSLKIGG